VVSNDVKLNDVGNVPSYDWSLEKRALQQIDDARKRNLEGMQQLDEKRKLLVQKRMEKLSTRNADDTHKLDDSLQKSTSPSFITNSNSQSHESVKQVTGKLEASSIGKPGQTSAVKFDVLEFEQGLPPLAPWDTPATLQDELHAIGEVLGVNRSTPKLATSPASPNRTHQVTPPPVVPPKPGKISSSPIPPVPVPPRPPQDFSHQEKQLWNEVLTMGFSALLAERGIRQFHLDKAKVMDFVVNQPVLAKSFDHEDVELALALFDAQLDKSKRFLEVFVQLKEMGFPREEVREALMLKDCDVDAAMDYLLTRS